MTATSDQNGEYKKYLHVGCGNRYYEGFINSDLRDEWKGKKYRLDLQMDMAKPWPYENDSIDGIVGMGVFQQLYWRDLVFAFREAYRVLKNGGVLRIGTPMLESGFPVDHALGWNNINLFNFNLLKDVLVDHVKFSKCRLQNYKQSDNPDLAIMDNRIDHMFYVEAVK